MALFNWFQSKSANSAKLNAQEGINPTRQSNGAAAASSIPPSGHSRPVVDTGSRDAIQRSEERKAKRQARREQLYAAIRQGMTRAGVLSASYKFKVLSLDQRGDQFLVMMDVHPSLGLHDEKIGRAEAFIGQTARTQFNIGVTAVYWRVEVGVNQGAQAPVGTTSRPAPLTGTALPGVKKPSPTRYEPIHDEEVEAFKRAMSLSNARTASVTTAGLPTAADGAAKSHNGLRSYTLMTGFEDTEMPESSALPALSGTQYGDLN